MPSGVHHPRQENVIQSPYENKMTFVCIKGIFGKKKYKLKVYRGIGYTVVVNKCIYYT